MTDRGHIASRIGQLADWQHGYVTRAQMLGFGVSERTISRRIAKRDLIAGHLGVYGSHQLKATGLNELLERSSRARRLIDPTQNATRSPLEDAFRRWIWRHRLPMPTINRRSGGREVDTVFEAERVIVELDSWTDHGDRTSFRADRARARRNAADGYLPLRYPRHDLTDAEAHRLRHILDARRQS